MLRPLLYAHRGAAAECPENTLPSFVRALEHGADVLEMDVHLTSDGHVVVSHDPDGRRRAGVAAEIRRCTLARVKTWDVGGGFHMPTLEEVLVELPGARLNVDVKQRRPDMTERVVNLLRRLRAEDRVLLASFHTATLRRIRSSAIAAPPPSGVGGRRPARPARVGPASAGAMARARPAAHPHRAGHSAAQERHRQVPRPRPRGGFLDRHDPDQALAALDLGADGIMTDDPAAIAPVFATRRRAQSERTI